jgi:hypothetical protein
MAILKRCRLPFFLSVFDELCPILHQKIRDPRRESCISDMVQSHGEPAINAVLDRMASPGEAIRIHALRVLMRINEPRLVSRLLPILRNSGPWDRCEAMEALMKFCPSEAVAIWAEQAEFEVDTFFSSRPGWGRTEPVSCVAKGLEEALLKHPSKAKPETLTRIMSLRDLPLIKHEAESDPEVSRPASLQIIGFSKSREYARRELTRRGI